MPTPLLQYGSVVRVAPRRLIWLCVGTAGLLLFCVWAVRVSFQKLYYHQRDGVRSALRTIPGAGEPRINGFDDGIGWKVVDAEVNIDGSAGRRIVLGAPWGGELRNGSRMRLDEIGPFSLSVEVGDERQYVQGLDLGEDSEFRAVLPFHLRDVSDLANHYDEIMAFVEREPAGTFTAHGTTRTYRIIARKFPVDSANPAPGNAR